MTPLPTVLIAPDTFKGSLRSDRVAEAMAAGLARGLPGWRLVRRPLSDGGEGFAAIVTAALGGRLRRVGVQGPLPSCRRVARIGWIDATRTAVIESAQAIGLSLLKPEDRDPTRTNSFGLGQMIAAALGWKARRILIGLGGSSTCDGGIGMARALGWRFEFGSAARPDRMLLLERIHPPSTAVQDALSEVQILAACDVANPLLGPDGSAAVYAPQKGATPSQVRALEAGLGALDLAARRDLGRSPTGHPGAGAAGGLGWGLMTFLGAGLRPGLEIVLEAVDFERAIREVDWVLTGEGNLDRQSLQGKTGIGLARRCRTRGVPVVFLAGRVDLDIPTLAANGVTAAFSIVNGSMPLETACRSARKLIERTSESVGRLMGAAFLTRSGKKSGPPEVQPFIPEAVSPGPLDPS